MGFAYQVAFVRVLGRFLQQAPLEIDGEIHAGDDDVKGDDDDGGEDAGDDDSGHDDAGDDDNGDDDDDEAAASLVDPWTGESITDEAGGDAAYNRSRTLARGYGGTGAGDGTGAGRRAREPARTYPPSAAAALYGGDQETTTAGPPPHPARPETSGAARE